MEEIKIFVENVLSMTGLNTSSIPLFRHILLVVITVFLAWLSDFACRRLLVPLVGKLTQKTEAKWDDVLLSRKVLVSACHIVPAVIIWEVLPMVFYQFPIIQEVLKRITAVYITVMTVRTITVFINSFNQLETQNRRSSKQQYLKSFCGLLKIVMYFMAAIVVIAIVLGKSPVTLFAGLGATSAILMLVFKDTIEGLVAGVRLTSNDMLHKGDWITVPNTQVNGIVTDITLTTVKVQNFDNTIITVSPTSLVNGSFQNWIGMQQGLGRRVQRKVYFDVKSIDFIEEANEEKKDKNTIRKTNMGKFRKDIEAWLLTREDVNPNMLCMVRQIEATQCGIPMEFYFFLKHKEWVAYEHHLAEIMEYIYARAKDYGLKIYEQYPEQ